MDTQPELARAKHTAVARLFGDVLPHTSPLAQLVQATPVNDRPPTTINNRPPATIDGRPPTTIYAHVEPPKTMEPFVYDRIMDDNHWEYQIEEIYTMATTLDWVSPHTSQELTH